MAEIHQLIYPRNFDSDKLGLMRLLNICKGAQEIANRFQNTGRAQAANKINCGILMIMQGYQFIQEQERPSSTARKMTASSGTPIEPKQPA